MWAERYDRDVQDIFAIQDEIARNVASLTAGHVKTVGASRSRERPTESLSAYDLFLRARAIVTQYGDMKECEALLVRAIELDPDYAIAHAMMGNALNVQSMYDGDMARRERAAEFARRAIRLDADEPWGHGMLGFCLTFLRRVPEAGIHFERATQLNPNDVFIAMHYAIWLCYAGHIERSLIVMQEVLKRDPFAHDWFWDVYCMALVVAGKYDDALAAFGRMVMPPPWTLVYAAIAKINLGDTAGATTLLARSRQCDPNMSPEDYIRVDPYVDEEVPERLIADIKKAA